MSDVLLDTKSLKVTRDVHDDHVVDVTEHRDDRVDVAVRGLRPQPSPFLETRPWRLGEERDRPEPGLVIPGQPRLVRPSDGRYAGKHVVELVEPSGLVRLIPQIRGGAISASGLFYLTFRDIFQNDTAVDLLADTIKAALFTNSVTNPNFDTNTAYAAAPFNANEVAGTGYTAGGAALANDTITVSSGTLVYDADDTSWAGSTITNARGALLYDDTITTPVADPAIGLVNFGADYSTSNGTFTIQWAAGGIFTIDLTP